MNFWLSYGINKIQSVFIGWSQDKEVIWLSHIDVLLKNTTYLVEPSSLCLDQLPQLWMNFWRSYGVKNDAEDTRGLAMDKMVKWFLYIDTNEAET